MNGDYHSRPSIRSTWKGPIGKLLTNRKIAEYARAGRYPSLLVLPPLANPKCECGSTETRYMDWKFLPKGGNYCSACRIKYKNARDKQRELDETMEEKMRDAKRMEMYI